MSYKEKDVRGNWPWHYAGRSGVTERRTEDCAGDGVMSAVRKPSYLQDFLQRESRVQMHGFAVW